MNDKDIIKELYKTLELCLDYGCMSGDESVIDKVIEVLEKYEEFVNEDT